MAKRFTDTDKWKRPWFNELPLKAKVVWMYILDNCDHAGIWQADFKLLSFQVGFPVTPRHFVEWFGVKAQSFGDKYHLPSFIEFQYGTLNPSNKVHRSALDLIEKLDSHKGLESPMDTVQDKDKDKDKEKEEEGAYDFDSLFASYPKRLGDQGKKHAFKKLEKDFRTPLAYQRLQKAVQNYAAHCDDEKKTGTAYVKQFVTFVNSFWEEWADLEAAPIPKLKGMADLDAEDEAANRG